MIRARLPASVVALGIISLLNDVSSEMIFPLLPAFLTSVIGASPTFLGAVEGAADSLSSLLRLPTGWLADRMRRRKPLVVAGYATANLARPCVAFATAPWHVLAVRLLDRLGKGIRTAPRDALLADSVAPSERGRAFGFHQSMDHAGAVVGPLLASVLFVVLGRSYQNLFLLASIPGLAVVVLAAVRVQEAPVRTVDAAPELAASDTPLGRRFHLLMVAIVLFGLGSSTDAFLLLSLQQAGVDVALLPVLWAALHVVKTLSAYPCGILSDRLGRMPMIISGWAYYALVYAAFAYAAGPVAQAAIFVAYGLFYGLTAGAERALVADLVPAARRGMAFGIYHTALGITALPASLAFGAIWQAYGRASAFALGTVMAGLGTAVLLAMLIKPESPR